MNDLLNFTPLPAAQAFSTGSVAPGYQTPVSEIEKYIREGAWKRHIDPEEAVKVFSGEGRSGWQSNFVKGGKREKSYGPFQLFTEGGLGNVFKKETGLDPQDPRTWKTNVDFALDKAAEGGWGPWYGRPGSKTQGLERAKPLGKSKWSPFMLGPADTSAPDEMAAPAAPSEDSMANLPTLNFMDYLMPSAQAAESVPAFDPGALAPPTKVKTVPITPDQAVGGPGPMVSAGGAAGGYTPSPVDTSPIMELFKARLDSLEEKPESKREMIARMLINFGAGTAIGASDIKGRTKGPGTLEALSGGATSLGLGELKERDEAKDRGTKYSEKTFDALKELMKFQLDTQKEEELRRYRSASLATKGSTSDSRPPYDIISTIIDKMVEDEGITPAEAWNRLTESNPKLREILDTSGLLPAGV